MNAFSLFYELVNCNTISATKKMLEIKRNTRHFYQTIQKNEEKYGQLKIRTLRAKTNHNFNNR